MGIAVIPAPSSGGLNRYAQSYTSTGTFVTPSTCTSVEVFLVGGGSSGSSSPSTWGGSYLYWGGGGGGGQVIRRVVNVTPGTTYTVTVGSGGVDTSGVESGAASAPGGNTSFGSLVVANGAPGAVGAGVSTAGATSGSGATSFGLGPSNSISYPGAGAGGPAVASSGFYTAGPGVEGYGIGGIGTVDNTSGANGGNNTGHGGASTRTHGTNGSPGGSGYAVVSYWS